MERKVTRVSLVCINWKVELVQFSSLTNTKNFSCDNIHKIHLCQWYSNTSIIFLLSCLYLQGKRNKNCQKSSAVHINLCLLKHFSLQHNKSTEHHAVFYWHCKKLFFFLSLRFLSSWFLFSRCFPQASGTI